MRTKAKIFEIVYSPSNRVVKEERACICLKVDDGVRPAYWTQPLLPSELARILSVGYGAEDPETQGISVATALATSAAFNFTSRSDREGTRVAGEPVVPKHPLAEMGDRGGHGKWLGDVRVRKIEPTRAALKALGVKADKHGPLQKETTAKKGESAEIKAARQAAVDALLAELDLSALVTELKTELEPKAPPAPKYKLIKKGTI